MEFELHENSFVGCVYYLTSGPGPVDVAPSRAGLRIYWTAAPR